MNVEKGIMRDVFIGDLYKRMASDRRIFFVTADFGAPKLDKLREDFRDRFINVGIAEQNLINISTGLALEGFTVYAYAIAPFLVMRAYEQIRNNLSLLSHTEELNVNLIGVGVGLSYDVSGPTHHTFEDISIIRALPNMTIFSPSDHILAGKFVDYSIQHKNPKYLRLDGKPVPVIYHNGEDIDFQKGYCELAKGERVCIVSTGYMTHTALKAANKLRAEGITPGLIDVFLLKPLDEDSFFTQVSTYDYIVTIEEAYIHKGGLDSLVSNILDAHESNIRLKRIGFRDTYVFDIGSRDYLHRKMNVAEDNVVGFIKTCFD
jgi:transketolase